MKGLQLRLLERLAQGLYRRNRVSNNFFSAGASSAKLGNLNPAYLVLLLRYGK